MLTRRSALGALGAVPLAAAARRPNIVLIMTDDQGYGDLSLHGNTKIATPHLDALAQSGAQFTRFHVSPVCSPTRSSLLTGRYTYRTGVVDTSYGRSMMRSTESTLAEMLRPAGYRTGIFGKWHLGDNYPLRAIDQGFDESLVLNGGGILQPSDPPEALTGVAPSYFNPVLSRNGVWEKTQGYCTDVFFREATSFIDRAGLQPFFCYIATNAPHTPLEVDEAWVKKHRAQGLNDTTAKVHAMVENIDDNVGRLLAHLKAKKLEDSTLVVFLTDNGPQQERYNAGMRGRKASVYEGGTRVPCFMRWPGVVSPGTRIDRLAAHIDVVPTLLEATKTKTVAKLDGRSLLPLLTDPQAKDSWSDRTVFLQWHRGDAPEKYRQSAVLTQRYKLVDGKELYDLEADPAETTDISTREPGPVRQLKISYDTWFEDVSRQGYAPPRILVSKKAPTQVTRQDRRGTDTSWDTKRIGYWELQAVHAGPYKVTILFDELPADGEFEATWLGKHPVRMGQKRLDLPAVRLPIGPARFEAKITTANETRGIQYAYFQP